MKNLIFFILSNFFIYNVTGISQEIPNYEKYVMAILQDGNWICTGALLNQNYVITAARCVVDKPVSWLWLMLGSLDPLHANDFYQAKEVCIHPQFPRFYVEGKPKPNNIALIQLEKPVTFDSYMQPIQLSITPIPEQQLDCEQIFFMMLRNGFHETEQTLLVNVVVHTLQQCKNYFGELLDNELCVTTAPLVKYNLTGDQGSPVICDGQLFGILSDGLTDEKSNGYSRISMVAPYIDWIAGIISPLTDED